MYFSITYHTTLIPHTSSEHSEGTMYGRGSTGMGQLGKGPQGQVQAPPAGGVRIGAG